MVKHSCINFKTLLEYEIGIIESIPDSERADYILHNGIRLRETFCESHCPIGRYLRRYDKYMQSKLDRLRLSGL